MKTTMTMMTMISDDDTAIRRTKNTSTALAVTQCSNNYETTKISTRNVAARK